MGSPNLSALVARLRESLDVLHGREFRLLFAGQAVSVLGDRMVAVALAFAVLEIGGSATDVGLVLAAGVFPLVGSVLVGGVVADRASRRAVMVVADLVRVASQGTMAACSIGNLLWGAWSALGPVVADRDLGGAAAWGTVLAAMGVGALIGSLLATQVEPRRPLVFVALTDGLFALPLAFLAAAPPVALLACGALLSGAGMMLGISVWESTLQRHIPGESLSRISSYDWFGSLAFSPLGLVIWAPVGAAIGISLSLWLAFGLSVAPTLALLTVPDIRHLRATPARLTSPAGSLT